MRGPETLLRLAQGLQPVSGGKCIPYYRATLPFEPHHRIEVQFRHSPTLPQPDKNFPEVAHPTLPPAELETSVLTVGCVHLIRIAHACLVTLAACSSLAYVACLTSRGDHL